MEGQGLPDPQNMFSDCFKLNIPDPRNSTYEKNCTQILITNNEIRQLAKDTPALRRQHLTDLIGLAEQKYDTL